MISVGLREQKLRDAVLRGDFREVMRLIDSGVSVNSASEVSYVYYSDSICICILLYCAVRQAVWCTCDGGVASVRVWLHIYLHL